MSEQQEIEPEILPGITMEYLLLLLDEQFTRLKEKLTLPDDWSDEIFNQGSLAINELLCGEISTDCLMLFLPVIPFKTITLEWQGELLCNGQKLQIDLNPEEVKDCSTPSLKICYYLLGVDCFSPAGLTTNQRSPLNAAELLAFCLHSDERIWKKGARLMAAGSRSAEDENMAVAISRKNGLVRIHWQPLNGDLNGWLVPVCQKRS